LHRDQKVCFRFFSFFYIIKIQMLDFNDSEEQPHPSLNDECEKTGMIPRALPPGPNIEAYSYWRGALGGARLVVGPMVDQSELAWRILARRHGAELVYTPMVNAKIYMALNNNTAVRSQHFATVPSSVCDENGRPLDRPLIAQLCGSDPQTMLETALLLQDHCDGIDVNLGCPQGIARRGNYGAFLSDDIPLVERIVRTLREGLRVPVSCKIRVLKSHNATIEYAQRLVSAGASLLTIHGRTRDQNGVNSGLADWAHIKAVKQSVSVPVFANGGILYGEDVERALIATGADGVMTAEPHLHNPGLLEGSHPLVWEAASEYLAIVRDIRDKHGIETATTAIRAHLFRIFRAFVGDWPRIREDLVTARTLDAFDAVVAEVRRVLEPEMERHNNTPDSSLESVTSNEYIKNLPRWLCQPYIRAQPEKNKTKPEVAVETREKDSVEDAEMNAVAEERQANRIAIYAARKKERFEGREKRIREREEKKCFGKICQGSSIRSAACSFSMCYKCCEEHIKANPENGKTCSKHSSSKKTRKCDSSIIHESVTNVV
jgi:tRNA-dihydrouridine synthase 1